jgi:hypothetical protein
LAALGSGRATDDPSGTSAAKLAARLSADAD